MEVSRGGAYGLGLSQVAITVGVVLFSPAVEVDVFVPHARLNGNHSFVQLSSEATTVHLGMGVIGASVLAGMFAMVTYQAAEQTLANQDFQADVLEQMGMWEALFWMYCMVVHGIVVLIVCDPVNIFGAVSATSFMAYFIFRACSPKSATINLTQENLNILGYGLGVVQTVVQMTETRGNGVSVVMLMVVLDYFLGLGHTYDRQATIQTVSNCRLFYVCGCALGLALLYGMSGSAAGIPSA
jgi:hypothetical protein